jgi:hypothetical protein
VSLVVFPADAEADDQSDVTCVGFEQMPMIMSPKVLAEILEVSMKTLERWRIARERDGKTGPAWHKIPGSSLIRYSRTDVVSWFAACREPEVAS